MEANYSIYPLGGELAKKGYRVLCGQVKDPASSQEEKMLDIKHAVQFLRAFPGIRRVVL